MTDRTRVVVVGAGLVGLACAWACTGPGTHVTVVDPAPATGATDAAAGMLAAVAETYHDERELSALLVAAARTYPALVADVARASGRPTGHRDTPTLVVGADAADRAALADLHELALGLGLRSERLTTRAARRLEPLLSPAISGAFLATDDHQVDPRVFAAALRDALARAGATHVPARATHVLHVGGPTSAVTGVRLDDGTDVPADAVVVANALDAPHLHGLPLDLTAGLRPVHGDILRLAPPTGWDGALRHTVRGLVNGAPVYLVPRDDGSLVLGATSREDGRDGVLAGGVHELLRDAVRIVPAVADHEITQMLARPRPATPDNRPLLGLLGPGLALATGFGRNGILLAPVAGRAVAHLLGLPVPRWAAATPLPDLTPTDPARLHLPTLEESP